MTRQRIGSQAALLAAALAAGLVGCGDGDGDGEAVQDGGFDSGGGGRIGAGRGGFGGNAGGNAGPSLAECVDKTQTATAGAVEAECISCVCGDGPSLAVACNETCWNLLTCYEAACAKVDVSDMNAVAGCALMHCEEFFEAIAPASELIKLIARTCTDECIGKMTPPPDAGLDGGE